MTKQRFRNRNYLQLIREIGRSQPKALPLQQATGFGYLLIIRMNHSSVILLVADKAINAIGCSESEQPDYPQPLGR